MFARCWRVTNFALDDLTFVISHFLPHLAATASGASSRPRGSTAAPSRHRHNLLNRTSDLNLLQLTDNKQLLAKKPLKRAHVINGS